MSPLNTPSRSPNLPFSSKQWLTEPADASNNLYYIKSATGSYLSITGKPTPGLPLICSSDKQVWEIRPDIKDLQLVKYVLMTF